MQSLLDTEREEGVGEQDALGVQLLPGAGLAEGLTCRQDREMQPPGRPSCLGERLP